MVFSKLVPQLNLDDGLLEQPTQGAGFQEGVETVVGPSVHVEGDFASKGDIIVRGKVTGTVETSQLLTIEQGARVVAKIKARSAKIAGHVKGNITITDSLDLLATAQVVGDVETKILSIAPGAVFQGHITMTTLVTVDDKIDARPHERQTGFKKNSSNNKT